MTNPNVILGGNDLEENDVVDIFDEVLDLFNKHLKKEGLKFAEMHDPEQMDGDWQALVAYTKNIFKSVEVVLAGYITLDTDKMEGYVSLEMLTVFEEMIEEPVVAVKYSADPDKGKVQLEGSPEWY